MMQTSSEKSTPVAATLTAPLPFGLGEVEGRMALVLPAPETETRSFRLFPWLKKLGWDSAQVYLGVKPQQDAGTLPGRRMLLELGLRRRGMTNSYKRPAEAFPAIGSGYFHAGLLREEADEIFYQAPTLPLALEAIVLVWAVTPAPAPEDTPYRPATVRRGREEFPARIKFLLSPPDQVLTVPYLAQHPDGRLALLCNAEYAGTRYWHYAMKSFSSDNGASWSTPEYLNGAPELGMGMGLCRTDGERLLAYCHDVEHRLRVVSDDFGASWRILNAVEPPEGYEQIHHWDPPLAVDGVLYEAAYTDDGHSVNQPWLHRSHDGGVTWSDWVAIPQWRGVNEVLLFRKRDGGFIAGCRAQNRSAETDQSDALAVSLSDDAESWSELIAIQPHGRMHPSIVELPDRRLIMTYVVREGYPDSADGYPRFGLEAVESRDGGKSWSSDSPYLLAEFTAEHIKGKERWAAAIQSTFSVLLPSGEILTVFGAAHRADFNARKQQMPRDLGFLQWKPAAR